MGALRERHPGWSITRPWYCGREWWEASRPGGPRLLRRTAEELDEAIGASGVVTAGPAEERVRAAYGDRWEFGTQGGEVTAQRAGGGPVLAARSWPVLEALLYGARRGGLAVAVTARHRRP